ncbi:hypothetical protein DFH28DRAFT_896500, partial [Melampsora americana]
MATGSPDPNAFGQIFDAPAPLLDDSDEAPPPPKILSDTIDVLPKRSQIPLLAEFAKKKARTSTPGLEATEDPNSTPDTPRSERISRMIPGNEDDRSLTALLTKLVSVANSAIQLPARGRMPNRIQVDVESCADILVLINAAFDRHQFNMTKKSLFCNPASSLECPTKAAAPLMTQATSQTPPHDFQISSLVEKFDVLSETISSLVSSLPALSTTPRNRGTASDPSSYAAKASKASQAGATAQPQKPRANPTSGSRPSLKARAVNIVTLTQLDRTQVALKDLTVTQLIQGFNNAF